MLIYCLIQSLCTPLNFSIIIDKSCTLHILFRLSHFNLTYPLFSFPSIIINHNLFQKYFHFKLLSDFTEMKKRCEEKNWSDYKNMSNIGNDISRLLSLYEVSNYNCLHIILDIITNVRWNLFCDDLCMDCN